MNIETYTLKDAGIEHLMRHGALTGPDAIGRMVGHVGGGEVAVIRCNPDSRFRGAFVHSAPVLKFGAAK